MATTESRSGFRLPWAGEHRTDDQNDGDRPADAEAEIVDQGADAMATPETPTTATAMADPEGTSVVESARHASAPADAPVDVPPATSATAPAALPPGPPGGRKPTKFLADLTKAMQAAAEAERQETLELFQLEAKSFVESIHGRSATEAEDLRKQADEDIASIREWSKAEIARIREETDQKISARKADLSEEIDDHAARIEREIDRVQQTVADYERQMAAFFESLLGETDPTRFAALASNLPEPPSFEGLLAAEAAPAPVAPALAEAPVEAAAAAASNESADAAPVGEWAGEAPADTATDSSSIDQEAAFAAIEAAARAADADDAQVEVPSAADGAVDADTDDASDATADGPIDPRLSALGLANFDAAEAEALADLPSADDEIEEIADDALAARLAGLVPAASADGEHDGFASHSDDHAAAEPPTAHTSVVVTGLISVASIASFKRHLARVPSVRTVGVTSGPDGEFVFAVSHDPGLDLRDVVPGLPGFGARVTESGDGVIKATAHDVESGA
jgi:hypothetical protein